MIVHAKADVADQNRSSTIKDIEVDPPKAGEVRAAIKASDHAETGKPKAGFHPMAGIVWDRQGIVILKICHTRIPQVLSPAIFRLPAEIAAGVCFLRVAPERAIESDRRAVSWGLSNPSRMPDKIGVIGSDTNR